MAAEEIVKEAEGMSRRFALISADLQNRNPKPFNHRGHKGHGEKKQNQEILRGLARIWIVSNADMQSVL
jgi:hypothetical protein